MVKQKHLSALSIAKAVNAKVRQIQSK